MPELGRTQYCLGAVVLTLNATTMPATPTGVVLVMVSSCGGMGSWVRGRGNSSSFSGCSVMNWSMVV
jgi:hypothetical protein